MLGLLAGLFLAAGLVAATLVMRWYLLAVFRLKARPLRLDLWMLLLIPLLFVGSQFLPSLETITHNATFVQHIVGGGIVSALVYRFLYVQLGLRWPWQLQLLGLFAVTSSLGVLNELIEFLATATHLYIVDGTDTWYDLTANTLGSLIGIVGLLLHGRLVKIARKS